MDKSPSNVQSDDAPGFEKQEPWKTRRPILGIIGTGRTCTHAQRSTARALGQAAIEAGFRIVTGGLDGVMEAACQGAQATSCYRDGDTIGILPGIDAGQANRWTDIVIPTGMGVARNVIVVQTADVVIAIGGGSGTLSEIALAWQVRRPLIALTESGGWATHLTNQLNGHHPEDPIYGVSTPAQAVQLAQRLRLTDNRTCEGDHLP